MVSCIKKKWSKWSIWPLIVTLTGITSPVHLHFVCDLKASQMYELLIYEFKLDQNATKATQNFNCTIGKGIVDDGTVTRCLKKFRSTIKQWIRYLSVHVFCHLHDLNKTILSGWIVPQVIKMLQNFTDSPWDFSSMKIVSEKISAMLRISLLSKQKFPRKFYIVD